MLNYSGPAGESGALRSISSPKCIDCDAIADFIDSVTKDDGQISGRGWTFLSTESMIKQTGGAIIVKAAVRVNAQTVVAKRGGRNQEFDGGRRVKNFHLTPTNGTWKLAQLDQGVS